MKKSVAAGFVGLLAAGSGAAIAGPAFAQDAEEPNERHEDRAERRAVKIETLTSILGLSAEELQAAKQSGQSIADIAAEQGVALEDVVNALIADAQARIEEKVAAGDLDAAQAEEITGRLEDRLSARLNGEAPERGQRGQRGRGGAGGERMGEKLDALTSILGVDAEELRNARSAGESIADVAAAQGVAVEDVVDALVADAQARIDDKVAAGDVGADRAAELSDRIEDKVTALVNGERPERGERSEEGRRGFGRGFGRGN